MSAQQPAPRFKIGDLVEHVGAPHRRGKVTKSEWVAAKASVFHWPRWRYRVKWDSGQNVGIIFDESVLRPVSVIDQLGELA